MGVETSFGIGELARRTERSVHTIRWYEAQGLIPNVDRNPGGRRRYAAWHVEWLSFLETLAQEQRSRPWPRVPGSRVPQAPE